MIEYLKGTRTLSFVLPILSVGFLSVALGTVFFLNNQLTRCVRYVTFSGFFIMYVFTLMTATTSVTFTFVFPLATLFCMYLDRWFMTIVCSSVFTLNGVYIVQKLSSVKKLEIGEAAYNQFTTTILIHSFVLVLFMSSLIAVVYVFNRLKKAMDHKIQEAIDARLTEQKLFAQATIDGLTGAYNRRHFVEKVREQLNETSAASSLLLLDIDDFKQVNDVHGHLAGDQVLIEFSSIMKQVYEGQGIAGRVGGEEFAVFLLGKSEEESQAIAERLRETIGNSKVRLNEDKQITVTVSGGIAYAKRSGLTFEELFQQADKALYTSKECGKNRITLAETL